MVLEALKFMILGMGIVYFFLFVLILAIEYQAKFINKYLVKEESSSTSEPSSQKSTGIDNKKVAAIIGAIIQHKKNS